VTVPIKPHLPGVLGAIVARRLEDLAGGAPRAVEPAPSRGGFYRALASPGLSIIAELKPRSPSKGVLRDGDLIPIARIYDRRAAAISVLTEAPHFGGSFELLGAVRSAVSAPIVMKDFVVSEAQILDGRRNGADAVLLMASILPPGSIEILLATTRRLGMDALVEVHTAEELGEVLSTSARIIGVNCRDLTTLEIDRSVFDRIGPRIPADRLVVFESGIGSRGDVDAIRTRCDAVLVGTTLMRAPDVLAKIEELFG
jgi:indole-3-glycerol phosphate synthase